MIRDWARLGTYSPEQLANLTLVFDLASAQLKLGQQEERLRGQLARLIMVMAKRGSRSEHDLATAVVQTFRTLHQKREETL